MLSVSAIEFGWIVVNLTASVLTLTALFDARADRTAVRLLNGHARELAADGIVRREVIRLVVQLMLLSIVIPGLFSDREITLSPVVLALIGIAVLLAFQTFLDARERKALTALVAADVIKDRDTGYARLERLVTENTVISSEGVVAAERAYDAANHVKERFDQVNDRITAGEARADARHAGDAT